jgi:hypothetical protein
VDEPRPQPPPNEAPTANDGRNEAERQEAQHANSLDDENVRERSLPDEIEPEEADLDEDRRYQATEEARQR